MDEYTKKDFAKIVKRTALEVRRMMRLTDSECGRVYDRNQEGLDISVDLYGNYAKIVDYTEGGMAEDEVTAIIDEVSRMAYVERSKIVYQIRKKREGAEQHGLQSEASLAFPVKESGLVFNVDLTSHIDTGLFLDMANMRRFIRENAYGKSVLNLFCYTGSFSVYAAAGLAKKVVSVDLANTAVARTEENLKANGFLSCADYPVVASDAMAYLEEAKERGEKYDIIIFDPPSFSNSNKMDGVFDVQKDYLDYIYAAQALMSNGAVLIFSTNFINFQFDKKLLKASFRITELTDEMRCVGFGRKKSTVRMWSLEKVAEMKMPQKKQRAKKDAGTIMEKVNDESLDRLTLSWETETPEVQGEANNAEKPAKEMKEREERPRKRFDGDKGRRDYSDRPRRNFDDRPRRDFDDRPRRSYDDRPRRDFDDRPRRSFDDRPRRDFDDRPRRSFDDRPRRDFDDRPRRNYDDRPRRDFDDRPRRNYDDRPRRDFDDRPRRSYDDRPRRDFDDRPRRSFDDRPRRDFDDRPRRSFDDRPRRDFDDRPRRSFDDRPRRDFDDRPRRNFDDRKDAPRVKRSAPKPYGFDQFMETKSRKKDTEFIYNDED